MASTLTSKLLESSFANRRRNILMWGSRETAVLLCMAKRRDSLSEIWGQEEGASGAGAAPREGRGGGANDLLLEVNKGEEPERTETSIGIVEADGCNAYHAPAPHPHPFPALQFPVKFLLLANIFVWCGTPRGQDSCMQKQRKPMQTQTHPKFK